MHLAQNSGQIAGLIPHLIDKGVAMLQYVDDTIMFIHDDLDSAKNLNLLLYMFEQMSGLKIKFLKSEVLMVLHDDRRV